MFSFVIVVLFFTFHKWKLLIGILVKVTVTSPNGTNKIIIVNKITIAYVAECTLEVLKSKNYFLVMITTA